MKKSNKTYKRAFEKAFDVALKELSKNNCASIAELALFSEYMLNRTCALGDGRILSRRKFYNSANELPKECKADYEVYLRMVRNLAEHMFDK